MSVAGTVSELLGPGEWYPVPGFYFKVLVVGIAPTTDDCSFQEVSGIDVELQTESIEEGGGNSHTWQVPKNMRYSNLVLKRGVLPAVSFLSTWVQLVMASDFTDPISPKNIVVTLNNENGIPLYAWGFANAYPVKWSIAAMDSTKNDILAETIEFQYQYFRQVPVAALANRIESYF